MARDYALLGVDCSNGAVVRTLGPKVLLTSLNSTKTPLEPRPELWIFQTCITGWVSVDSDYGALSPMLRPDYQAAVRDRGALRRTKFASNVLELGGLALHSQSKHVFDCSARDFLANIAMRPPPLTCSPHKRHIDTRAHAV